MAVLYQVSKRWNYTVNATFQNLRSSRKLSSHNSCKKVYIVAVFISSYQLKMYFPLSSKGDMTFTAHDALLLLLRMQTGLRNICACERMVGKSFLKKDVFNSSHICPLHNQHRTVKSNRQGVNWVKKKKRRCFPLSLFVFSFYEMRWRNGQLLSKMSWVLPWHICQPLENAVICFAFFHPACISNMTAVIRIIKR